MEVGTLKELNVKPGDVVEYCGVDKYTISKKPNHLIGEYGKVIDYSFHWNTCKEFRIVSRATENPKLWRDMTDAEKGALLLAWHRREEIEMLFCSGEWVTVTPQWAPNRAYRIRPEPNREKVTLRYNQSLLRYSIWMTPDDAIPKNMPDITFDLIDGKPDLASVKMEEL
jgi:hypothetical protein